MPGPRRATRARRPSRSRKEIEEERFAPKPLTPREVFRKRVIQVGVGILLVAFLFTSGVMCVNMGSGTPQEQPEQQAQRDELTEWREKLATNPADTQAMAQVGHFLMVQAAQKPPGDEQTKLLAEAEANLVKVKAIQDDPNRAAAMQDLARVQMIREDWPAAKATLDEALAYADRPLPATTDEAQATAVRETRLLERGSTMMLVAQMQAGQKKFVESLATLDELTKLNPPNAMEILFMKAALYQELGETQKALGQLDIAEKFATTQEDQFRIMLMKQQLMAPPPSPSPGGPVEIAPSPAPNASSPSPGAAAPSPSPAAVNPSPAPVVASPTPAPAAASPSPAPVASPTARPSP